MKSIFYAITAVTFFAFVNVLMEAKFSKLTTSALQVCLYGIMLPLSILLTALLKLRGQEIVVPSGSVILLVVGFSIMYYLGDFFYLKAFTNSGDVMTITTIIILLPVVCVILKYVWFGGTVPNTYQITSFVFAAISVLFAAKGSV